MSKQNPPRQKRRDRPSQDKQERYIQPSVLLSLYLNPSYGYEIIKNIQMFGFVEGHAPPGMIYRHLRQLEEDGLVLSEWKTEDPGPARRMYCITGEGIEVLTLWIDYMERQADNLYSFTERFRKAKKKRPKSGKGRS